jgi:NADH-quinone oxidoreductase subunit L
MRLLWLIPTLPLAGFLILTLARERLSKSQSALIGTGSVGLAALLATVASLSFLLSPPSGDVYTQILWTWIGIADFTPRFALYLDSLSLVMTLVITWVGFFIHLYSTEFMAEEEGYPRFFAYMNLFVAAMLILVLADDLLFLYLGWEGVGLCSYLLIGFWYRKPANGYAARKAFVMTRVGDTALVVGLLLLFANLGTLHIPLLLERATQEWAVGSGLAVAAAALLLGGAVGKSAQLPLQSWLPDAMAGPTPVSALIHAATMVTAGVYLIARTHVLFELAPAVQATVALIGALTLLLAACSALVQTDIKRILAYSTISQIGYMFLALGVGAWSAAIFHLMTHAFFKALLFLAAGTVILSLHHEHDIFKMGGLRRQLPVAFWGFLIGSASLAALPLVTAGFYSKELILGQVWVSPLGGPWLWTAGLVGALLTAFYIFRGCFVVFFGPLQTPVEKIPSPRMAISLVVLSILAVLGGFFPLPSVPGEGIIPGEAEARAEIIVELIAASVSVLGIYLAYVFFIRKPHWRAGFLETARRVYKIPIPALQRFWYGGWGFDSFYHRLLVRPFLGLARLSKDDMIDGVYRGTAALMRYGHRELSRTQTGQVRWYAGGVAVGAAVLLTLAVWL